MNKKISIIIPTAGNDSLRERNFRHCVKSIEQQEYDNYEVIIVEQTLDGSFYKESFKKDSFKWIGITDPLNRGFNLSWCRNVGAKIAEGEIIILMDSDMVFESKYLTEVNKLETVFSGGSSLYHWIFQEPVTRYFDSTRDFNYVYSFGNGGPKDMVFRFEPFTKGCGYGAVIIFNRNWYWNIFGGYPEDFFKYGWEDKAAVEIIKGLLNIEDESTFNRINYPLIHLSHFAKDGRNLEKNQELYNRIKGMDKKQLAKSLMELNLGDLTGPKILFK